LAIKSKRNNTRNERLCPEWLGIATDNIKQEGDVKMEGVPFYQQAGRFVIFQGGGLL
jgi:hypothetical protein